MADVAARVQNVPHGEVHTDEAATSTDSNASWATAKPTELDLGDKPIVLFAFPVLARSAADALVGHGAAADSIYPAFPAAALPVRAALLSLLRAPAVVQRVSDTVLFTVASKLKKFVSDERMRSRVRSGDVLGRTR